MSFRIAGDAIVGEMEIAASPEAVFDAFTNPEDLESWWGSDDMYRTFNWKLDLRKGGRWSREARSTTDNEIGTVQGVYLEVDPPNTLAFTWNPSWDPGESEVRIHFE